MFVEREKLEKKCQNDLLMFRQVGPFQTNMDLYLLERWCIDGMLCEIAQPEFTPTPKTYRTLM